MSVIGKELITADVFLLKKGCSTHSNCQNNSNTIWYI